ncbi:MAG: hypothetical protein ACRC7O_00100 [Fimbriiglobus sp.]
MSNPIRPLNRCRSCGDTWHPRGQNISDRCPTCRSTEVGKATAKSQGLAAPKMSESRFSGPVARAVFLGLCVIGLGLVVVPAIAGR